MVNSYTTHLGQTYSLSSNVVKGNDFDTMNQLDREYLEKANRMKQEKKCHVFYNLKKHKNYGYEYSQYFLIPIDAVDAEMIPLIFNGKNTDYWIGITYYHDMPDISYKEKLEIRKSFWDKDNMTRYEYEEQCADELRKMGFTNVETTSKSGDQGIDIIAWKDGLKYGIQCKHYKGSVGNKVIQEANTGAQYYDCDIAVVMTNSVFTKSAEELAHKIGVKLWSNSETYKEV